MAAVRHVAAAAATAAAGAAKAAAPSHCEERPAGAAPFPVRGGSEVLLVQVLHRHGARTPFRSLPGMPEPATPQWDALWGRCRVPAPRLAPVAAAASSPGPSLTSEGSGGSSAGALGRYGPCAGGQLTRLGEWQLEQLGSFLRRQYVQGVDGGPLVSPEFPAGDEFKVVSTRTSRTILSAQCLLRGLFPQAPDAQLEGLVKTPGGPKGDLLIPNHENCDRLRQLFHEEKRRVDSALLSTSTRIRLRGALGPSTEDLTLIMAGDPLRCLKGHGLALPAGVEGSLSDDLDLCGHALVEASLGGHGSQELRRLSYGLLLSEMQEQIMAAVEGRSALRLVVRSAHDLTVSGVLAALGLQLHSWPEFASNIIIELLRDRASGQCSVRVVCYDGTPTEAEGAAIDVEVPLQSWKNLVAPLVLREEDYLQQCRLPLGSPTPPPHSW